PPEDLGKRSEKLILLDEFAIQRVKREHARFPHAFLLKKVAAAKTKRERVDVMEHVWNEFFKGPNQALVWKADAIFGIKRKGKAGKIDDGDRAGGAPIRLRAQD